MSDVSKINLKPKSLEEAWETIGQLAQLIVELKEENARLKEQLNTNSKNSSLSPSKDLKKKKQTKPKSTRARGGQAGHKGQQRALKAYENLFTF